MRAFIIILMSLSLSTGFAQRTTVKRYGQLSVKGRCMVSEKGDTVQLRGMSMFWSQWMGKYYNAATVGWLVKDWKCDIIRAAMGVENGGYLADPKGEMMKVDSVVQACIDNGIYVIIDYHAHKAHENTAAAVKFFGKMAKKWGKYPNVIYETFNEPEADKDWKTVLKPYHEKVIKAIREHDPDNIIVCGSSNWDQRIEAPLADRIDDKNVMYTLHYYAASHRDGLRNTLKKCANKGLPIFVTEFGNCHYSGNKDFSPEQAKLWWDLLDQYQISWCKWSVSDKDETAAAIQPGTMYLSDWDEADLTESGKHVRNEIRTKNMAKEAAYKAKVKAEKAAAKAARKESKKLKKKK